MNISVRDLTFTYPNGVAALHDVSLDISSGERVAVVGQNGSGKTTLAKHLNALLRPSRGQVLIGEWDTREHTTAQFARRVGFLFQNPDEQIFKNRVADEIAFGPQQLRLSPVEIEARVTAALERTGLSARRNAHPYEVLPSERKWVALASVLAMDPPIFVLDEPTLGQDAREIARLGALIGELSQQGKTIVAITHDLDFVAENFERVIVMGQGRLLADGEAHHVLGKSALLAQTAVEPPSITRLGAALGMSETVLTVDEFLRNWTR